MKCRTTSSCWWKRDYQKATDLSDDSETDWRPHCLTWARHEFIDAARNDTVWNKATKKIRDQTATIPFEVLKVAIIQTWKEMFGAG
ncbi:DUF2513 domain-containing protein [Maioricimonas sp. JC845]|uniref:DUF2513 domain-containing protein n=1 Tax=Maioricimonas sp. JC845 TaxID=3232138 RepID=UPI00345AF2C9